LPGIVDLGGPPRLFDELAPALRAAFHAATSWDLRPGSLSDAERQRVATLRAERYENEDWNRRR
jgi:lipoate-protein ligase A